MVVPRKRVKAPEEGALAYLQKVKWLKLVGYADGLFFMPKKAKAAGNPTPTAFFYFPNATEEIDEKHFISYWRIFGVKQSIKDVN